MAVPRDCRCKNCTYVQLSLSAAVLAPVTLAAHQLTYSLWSLCSFLTSPLEQSALTFLPASRSREERTETAKLILGLGATAGVLGGCFAAGVPLVVPGMLTPDPALPPIIRTVLPQSFLAMLLCGIDVASNGLLVAAKDLRYVVRSMIITFVALTGYFFVCQRQGWGLPGVWWGLCAFFSLRAVQSIPRLPRNFGSAPGIPPPTSGAA